MPDLKSLLNVRTGLIAGLLAAVGWSSWPVLIEMASRWSSDPRYSHGYVIPLFALAILALGTRLQESLLAAEQLAARGLSATVADARYAKPLDEELILRLAEERTVILVEHKMRLVMGVSQRLLVLHHGELLAEGTPDDIRANDEVRRVYLGQRAH